MTYCIVLVCGQSIDNNVNVNMSFGLHIKMKFLAPLLLGDFKNFLIPPRIC